MRYGPPLLSGRSLSKLWIAGSLEAEAKREKVKTSPEMGPLLYDVVMFRQTKLALRSHV